MFFILAETLQHAKSETQVAGSKRKLLFSKLYTVLYVCMLHFFIIIQRTRISKQDTPNYQSC